MFGDGRRSSAAPPEGPVGLRPAGLIGPSIQGQGSVTKRKRDKRVPCAINTEASAAEGMGCVPLAQGSSTTDRDQRSRFCIARRGWGMKRRQNRLRWPRRGTWGMIRAGIFQTALWPGREATGPGGPEVDRPEGQHRPRASRVRKQMMFKIYVGNLSFDATESEVEQLFGQHGEVQSVAIVTDRDTGRSRGFGFVEMTDDAQGQAAIDAIDGSELGGRSLKVNKARPRERDQRGGGGGSGRDRW